MSQILELLQLLCKLQPKHTENSIVMQSSSLSYDSPTIPSTFVVWASLVTGASFHFLYCQIPLLRLSCKIGFSNVTLHFEEEAVGVDLSIVWPSPLPLSLFSSVWQVPPLFSSLYGPDPITSFGASASQITTPQACMIEEVQHLTQFPDSIVCRYMKL